MKAEGAALIGEALKTNTRINKLMLSSRQYSNIYDDSIITNQHIGNKMGGKGAIAFNESLMTNTSLTELCLERIQVK